MADRVLPIVESLAEGKRANDPLFTTKRGGLLNRGAVVRAVKWETTGQGRRLHDLRHTVACLWLARRVDPGTVQQWMGHESIATTNLYLHFLGSSAHTAGLDRLNEARPERSKMGLKTGPGYAGGTREMEAGE